MNSEISILYFDALTPIANLKHAITLRSGGVSAGPYAALNLGYHVGDDAAHVTENRKRLAARLGYEAEALTCGQQVHRAEVQVVDQSQRGQGAFDWQSALPETDALIVQEQQMPVLILVADCAPLLLVDPVRHVLAVVHAGWRGAVDHIAAQTVRHLQEEFQSRPADICAGIGPCLCAECFEIGTEVAETAGGIYAPAVIPPPDVTAKPHLDLRALLVHDLTQAGIVSEHIEVLGQCPRCLPEMFFSHRGQQGTAGRFGLVAWWD